MDLKKKANKFLFDVDGTLTPSRCHIDSEFKNWFLDFCRENQVYLVTGSDYPKTLEQLGEDICMAVKQIYNCSGNEVWSKGNLVELNTWDIPDEVESWMLEKVKSSNFPLRTGRHIESRTGTVNFSIVGRNATLAERVMYSKWDYETGERAQLAEEFNKTFPNLQAQIGGETGLDVFPKNHDKSQIINDFERNDRIYFFGDRTLPGGNDYTLALAIEQLPNGRVFRVTNWKQTFETLQYLVEARIAA